MSQLAKYRKKLNLTQEQLSQKSNISVRTIQRIEAGKILTGHTLDALSEALKINKEQLTKDNSDREEVNFVLIKWINLSSLLLIFIPLGSVLLPFAIMYWKRELNTVTKQIVSIQILWTLLFPIVTLSVILVGNLISLNKQSVPITMLLLLLVNLYIILRNTYELDKNQKLHFKLSFNIL